MFIVDLIDKTGDENQDVVHTYYNNDRLEYLYEETNNTS